MKRIINFTSNNKSKHEVGLVIKGGWTQEDYDEFNSRVYYIEKMLTNNKIITQIEIVVNGQYFTLKALWDTGATKSIIDTNKVKVLNLVDNGLDGGRISDIHNNETIVKLYDVELMLPNHSKVINTEVASHSISSKGCDIIIGMDIIQYGIFKLETGQIFTFECDRLI